MYRKTLIACSFSWNIFHQAPLTLGIFGCCLDTTLKSTDLSLKQHFFCRQNSSHCRWRQSAVRTIYWCVKKEQSSLRTANAGGNDKFPYVTNFLKIWKLPFTYQVNFFPERPYVNSEHLVSISPTTDHHVFTPRVSISLPTHTKFFFFLNNMFINNDSC